MNVDIVNRLVHLIANVDKIAYVDFVKIKEYLSTTEYDANFSQIFEAIETFYNTRHNKMPDFAWVHRQFPNLFTTYTQIEFHHDDVYVLQSILRQQSYKNKVLSATYSDDFDKSLNLLTEYKQENSDITEAPTSAVEVFKNFKEERKTNSGGIATGFIAIDSEIDFMQYKAFTCLIAPVKSFKTMTACNIVYNAIMNQGKNVIYFTLEDQYRSVWSNLLSKHSYITGFHITNNEIKKYKLTEERDNLFMKMQRNFDASMTGHFVCLSSENINAFTPDVIDSKLEYYQKLWGNIDMVVFDHFSIADDPIPGQHLVGPALKKAYVRHLTKKSISFGEKGFVLLGLSQITREYTEKLIKGDKMQSVGAAETSEIERSCNLMLCTYASEDMKKSGNLSMTIVINRNGPSDITVQLPIKPEFATIGEQFVEDYDDDLINSVLYGDAEIPVKTFAGFGISFTQFKDDLKSYQNQS